MNPSAKITKLCDEIHVLKNLSAENTRVAQIHYINSVIMGISEYIKTGICSKAFRAIDHRVNNSCFYTWKYIYPNSYMQMKVKLGELSNIPHRHEGYNDKTFAIKHQGMWIGITKSYITHSRHERFPFNQKMTPFTAEGRKMYVYKRKKEKPLPMNRPSVNSPDDLKMAVYSNNIYNFEYFMNREYAFNRDKWKCRCCGTDLTYRDDKHCHHVDNSLNLDRINKVPNLAWLCINCHYKVHSHSIPENVEPKTKKKILKMQEKLNKAKSVSE